LHRGKRKPAALDCAQGDVSLCAPSIAIENKGYDAMPKAYWVTCYREIKDPNKLAAYAKLAGPAVEKMGGRYIVRGTAAITFEHGQKERIVISEFDSLEQAKAAHDCPGYQEALRALGDGAVRDVRLVEGLS